jgi:iron(III) transport system substrate-binding protein
MSNTISRRNLLRGFGAAAGLAAGGSVLAACGSSPSKSGSSTSNGLAYQTHDAVVNAAKQEGALSVVTTFTEPSYTAFKKDLQSLYPFMDVTFTEGTGEDAQKILLELQSGQNQADSIYLDNAVKFTDYLPFVSDLDMTKLAKAGVLKIPTQLIDAKQPDIVSAGSGVACCVINPKVLPPDQAPKTWEDLLQPQFTGKFLLDVKPSGFASLVPSWGEPKVLDFAKQLNNQKPVYVRGDTESLTQLAAGEYGLKPFANYHSAWRIQQKQPDNIQMLILEPVPVRITQIEMIRKGAAHPASALLYHEYLASDAAQTIIDANEPRQSSIYVPGSALADLIQGKQTSVVSFDGYDQLQVWANDIVKAWGFPAPKGGSK